MGKCLDMVNSSGDVIIDDAGAAVIQADSVESAMLEVSLLQHKRLTLTQANIQALDTVAQVIATAEANKVHVFSHGLIYYHHNGTNFTAVGNIYMQYGNGVVLSNTLANFFNAGSAQIGLFLASEAGIGGGAGFDGYASLENRSLGLVSSVAATGAGGTATLDVWYRTLDFS